MDYRPPADPDSITELLFRTVSISTRRERRIYITTSPQGSAIKMQSYAKGGKDDGQPLGAPLFIFDREASQVVAALVGAAASIGATPFPITPAPHGTRQRPTKDTTA